MHNVVAARLSRRSVLRGGMLAAAGFMTTSLLADAPVAYAVPPGEGVRSRKASSSTLGFEAVPLGFGDEVVVPPGYTAVPFLPWGTALHPSGPRFVAGSPELVHGSGLTSTEDVTAGGVLEAAGLLFFAFAGYARIATLGDEVRDPARTIPRAVPLALGIALAVYAGVAVAALLAVGPGVLAAAAAPLAAVVEAGDSSWAAPVVRAGAAVAALGVLLSLLAGVSRTVLAMARTGDLPPGLAAVSPVHRVLARAQLLVSAAVLVLVLLFDLRDAIGFSSVAVLVYYAIAHASALRLRPDERRYPPAVAAGGLVGCLVLALSLPPVSVLYGAVALGLGSVGWLVRRRLRRRTRVGG